MEQIRTSWTFGGKFVDKMKNKNHFSEFLKISWGKFLFLILIFLLIFYFGLYFVALCDPCPCLKNVGIPSEFLKESVIGYNFNSNLGGLSCGTRTMNFYIFPLLIDIFFWYIIICLISFIVKLIRKK